MKLRKKFLAMVQQLLNLYQVVGTGERYPAYYSGYGQKGYKYFIRMQTDSASIYNASVRGGWYP